MGPDQELPGDPNAHADRRVAERQRGTRGEPLDPFFNSIPAASEKAYLELAGASHTAANSPNTTLAKYAISWLKRYIDNATRYEQFLCPAPSGSTISQYRDTFPG